MCGQSELEARRQSHVTAKRKLMGAVQGIRTDVARWIIEVCGDCAEIVIPRGGNVSRERIGNLQIYVLNTRKGIGHILLQAHLQSVVDRPSDGEQHLIGADSAVDTGEGCIWTGTAAAEVIPGIKAIASEVGDRSRVNIRVE